MTTLEETLGPGEVTREGELSSYRRVARRPGEDRLLRLELVSGPVDSKPGRPRSLLHLAHVTDLQLADVASPGRFEFLESYRGLQGTGSLVPAQRPQEALSPYVLDSMLRRIEAAQSAETGAPVGLVVSSGDSIDNAQWNEMTAYLALLGGGEVALSSSGRYEGVQRDDPNPLYWHPEEEGDQWQRLYGFPAVRGLLDRASRPFAALGSSIPWLSCFGNHEGLAFGEAIPTAAYREIVTGSQKATSLPLGLDALGRDDELFSAPEHFLAGASRSVRPDPARQMVGRREFVAAHLAAPGRPAGHGYDLVNLEDETTYFTYEPSPEVRVIVLDTANLDGAHRGSIGARQFAWLEERLVECHKRWLSPSGMVTEGGGPDRLVVIASHHGLSTLTNLRQLEGGLERDHPRYGRSEVAELLERFPNVVAWLNGHRHLNEITPRHSRAGGASGARAGYFEISTSSLADWPSQARLVELAANDDGTLSLFTTMLDHSPLLTLSPMEVPRGDDEEARGWLAALHRELAGNVPGVGFGSRLEGARLDRNCELLVPMPF